MLIDNVAIIGTGVAGAQCAESLRVSGFDGGVLLVGEEPWAPYERPPLSKAHLLGEPGASEGVFLHPDEWYAEHDVELITGVRAEALDARTGGVRWSDGSTRRVDRVLLATGGQPRRLNLIGSDAPNVHYLRSKDDADGLARALRPGAALVVIGMGVIGAEVAASARSMGCEVTVIEPAGSPMLRTLGLRFGGWLGQVHADNGVHVRLRTEVTGLIMGADGNVQAVECADGSQVACDAIVVGIGIDPRVELAREAGLAVGNGIQVDNQCRTSHPNIFAAGDVAERPGFEGGRVRLETFHNSAAQGAAAARSMLGETVDHRHPCRFWTDQYELELQMVGRLDDELPTVLRGKMSGAEFTAFFLDQGVVVGALSVNRAVDVGPMMRLVEQRLTVDPDRLSDTDLPLREALRTEVEPSSISVPNSAPVSVSEGAAISEPAENDGVPLCRTDDVEADEPFAVLVDGFPPLAVYRVEGDFFVTENTCTHGKADLTDGLQEGSRIECPFHGGAFDVITGAPTAFPCVRALQTFTPRIVDGWIVIDHSQAGEVEDDDIENPAIDSFDELRVASQ